MLRYFENLARALLGMKYDELSKTEKKVIASIANSEPVAENINQRFVEEQTLGQRLADKVATFGGSWTFIFSFILVMAAWMIINSVMLATHEAFDPYPYILLNLALSSLAALQAPIIMMSQNRQAQKDRLKTQASYEVALKSDLELMLLHQKIDRIMDHLTVESFVQNSDMKLHRPDPTR
ncbi:MAG: DUF1003 domain-containing protein [Gammaproteobacteria bacterium]|nr:DUF1003 domain-containing protein [Gammaproteobacteria bacterium]